jgi:hypothetical protein
VWGRTEFENDNTLVELLNLCRIEAQQQQEKSSLFKRLKDASADDDSSKVCSKF